MPPGSAYGPERTSMTDSRRMSTHKMLTFITKSAVVLADNRAKCVKIKR